MVRASGWIGLVIALMSFYLIALVVWMSLHYRTVAAVPRELVSDVQELLEQNKYNEALSSAAGRFLVPGAGAGSRGSQASLGPCPGTAGHGDLPTKTPPWKWSTARPIWPRSERLGPMIGLVGTVYGMIMAFRVIALTGSSAQANQLAAGISTALFATLEGIAISIPAIYFYAMFRNRIARLSLEVGLAAEPLLEQLRAAFERRPAPQPAPAPPTHPHPFAVSAALAAAASTGPRSALPPAES